MKVAKRIAVAITVVALGLQTAIALSSAPEVIIPPSKINVGNVTFTVIIVKKFAPKDPHRYRGRICDRDALQAGLCSDPWTIRIEEKQGLDEERNTVLHEVFHAILGTAVSDNIVTSSSFIDVLAPKLLEVFQKNPALMQYLRAGATLDTSQTVKAITRKAQEKQLRETLYLLLGGESVNWLGIYRHSTNWLARYHYLIERLSPELVHRLENDAPLATYLMIRTYSLPTLSLIALH